MDKQIKIGWIGTGVMGEPMCGHLLAAGFAVAVFSRTRNKAANLIEKGAFWCTTPAEVAQNAEVIFTMVGTPGEVREVYLSDQGVLAGVQAGSILVDMSTTAPSLSMELAERANELGAQAIDAPVSGGDIGAQNATLTIMLGGDVQAIEKIQPLLGCLGETVINMGDAGSGQQAKLCNQLVVANTMIGVCEALFYAERSGLDCEKLIAAIRPGAASCWVLDNLAPRMIKGDDAPGFMVEHFIKDLGIAVSEAEALDLDLPGLKLAHDLYVETQRLGHGKRGTQSLLHAIRNLS
ncbi:NAD(P)-dependent oxidoreductase [Pseudomonadota bacterium]